MSVDWAWWEALKHRKTEQGCLGGSYRVTKMLVWTKGETERE